MKYIIMCGWNYDSMPKHLKPIHGEPNVLRTVRLLREFGVEDIAISSNNPAFDGLGLEVLHHPNNYGNGGEWLEAFYPTDCPVCYIFGDVVFSLDAIRHIVNTETDSVQFFASAPAFSPYYVKQWAEPFAFKVQDLDFFWGAVNKTIELGQKGAFKRGPISWELWQVIKGTPLNEIDYTNYYVINDWTCDFDTDEEYEKLMGVLSCSCL